MKRNTLICIYLVKVSFDSSVSVGEGMGTFGWKDKEIQIWG